MKVVGIIAEYNPFHFGHLYHLKTSQKITGADHVVCVMSGNFVQRGEPAVVNKWARAEMALKCGADLVVELPVVFSLSSAEFFALGAVKLLTQMGIVDFLCFGSESGKLEEIQKIGMLLSSEPLELQKLIKTEVDKGLVFPKARANALVRFLGNNVNDLVIKPNNILGIEYIKAIHKLKSSIKPVTIKRIGADYNSETIDGRIVSAKALRNLLTGKHTDINTLYRFLPLTVFEILKKHYHDNLCPVVAEDFTLLVLGLLRRASLDELKHCMDVSEGLHNRIKKAAYRASSFKDLIKKIKTKRYTQTRIQRSVFQFMVGIKKADIKEASKIDTPLYIRVLGFNKKGRYLLKKIKNASSIPIITKVANYKKLSHPLIKQLISRDIMATDLYSLAYKNSQTRIGGQDYYTGPIIID
jgi:predicted nucleotidyltransferase